MRCPDCNKFVSYEAGEPERDGELDLTQPTQDKPTVLEIRGSVRIVLNCEECGTELKEATLDILKVAEVPEHPADQGMRWAEGSEWEPDEESFEATDRSEGKGRGTRTFYGASASWTFSRETVDANDPNNTGTETIEVDWDGDIQASGMDELV